MKRLDEEISKKSFSDWLACQNFSSTPVWSEVEQKNEPPDWYLTLENTRYAVETTSIVDSLQDFDPPLSSFAVSAYLKAFIEEVEVEATKRNILAGSYIVYLPPIPNFQQHRQWLFNKIISFVESTKDSPCDEEIHLGMVKNSSIVITRFPSNKNKIYEAISYGVKIESTASENLSRLIEKALKQKSEKLKKLDSPIFLLLLDSYLYSEISDWRKIVSDISIPLIFDSIFRTSANLPAKLLYSKHNK
jgi:hypothetical protein